MVKLVWPQEMMTRLGISLSCSQIPERVPLHARQSYRAQHQVVRRQKTEVSIRFKQRLYWGFQGNAKQCRVNSFSSVQSSHSAMSHSLWPHEPQHTKLHCPSPTPGVYPNSCPLSQWCHPTISSSVIPFSSCPQSFPASGSSPMSQLFASGGQSTGVSASTSVFPMNTQDWSPSGWTGWIFLQSKGLSRVFSNTTAQKHQFLSAQLSSQSNSHIHDHWKNHSLD